MSDSVSANHIKCYKICDIFNEQSNDHTQFMTGQDRLTSAGAKVMVLLKNRDL